jgi:multicomponent K+:H+ antiporter subunit F
MILAVVEFPEAGETALWSATLVQWAISIGLVSIMVGIFFCLDRVVRGPHLADRAIALDTIAIHMIGLVALFTIQLDSLVLFDGALVLSLLGFAGTVAVAQYLVRPHLRRRHRLRTGRPLPPRSTDH